MAGAETERLIIYILKQANTESYVNSMYKISKNLVFLQ